MVPTLPFYLLGRYLYEGALFMQKMVCGIASSHTCTHASTLDAGNFMRPLTERQGEQVGSPVEVAFEMGCIDQGRLQARAEQFGKNGYGLYFKGLDR